MGRRRERARIGPRLRVGEGQSTSSGGEANSMQLQAATQGTKKMGSLGSGIGDSGTEREVSVSQAGQNTKQEMKSRSFKKSSKKGKA